MMRAWVTTGTPSPVPRLALVDRPEPRPEPDEVLVKVLACGVCRTDLHVVDGDLSPHRPSVVPGHEVVGEIVAVGEDVPGGLRPGHLVGAVRFYEAKGLLTPERVGATRVFRRRDRARLILILRGKRLGFSLRDISEYLSLYDAHSQTAQVVMLTEMVDRRLGLLERQLTDLQTTISELREIKKLAMERVAQQA
jgi:DNA-binding transcriptional MerR regulator